MSKKISLITYIITHHWRIRISDRVDVDIVFFRVWCSSPLQTSGNEVV